MRYYIKRNTHKIARVLLALLLLAGIGLGTKYFIANRGEIGSLTDQSRPTTVSDSTPASISSRVLATGNISWGGHLHDLAEDSEAKSAYPFSELESFTRTQYDAWLGSLTCALKDDIPYRVDEASCTSAYLGNVKKWFNVLSMGNTPSGTGETSANTRQALMRAGIQYVGDDDPTLTNNLCDIVALPARFKLGDGSFKVASLPLALCSVNIEKFVPTNLQYEEIARYSRSLPVWVYSYTNGTSSIGQTEVQTNIYRSFIDYGAEIVIGNSQLAVKGAENYNGKLILYSLGNFIYSGIDTNTELHQSVSLSVTISAKIDQNMSAWANLALLCGDFHDTCLQSSTEKDLKKPSYSYEFKIVAGESSSDDLTSKSISLWQEQASKRLNWEALLPTLNNNK